jgi:hypothetical protein
MRRSILLALVLLAAGAVAVIVALDRDADESRPPSRAAVLLLGDSLNVGIEPLIGRYLPGWRITTNNESGRSTEAGIDELQRVRVPRVSALVISLGTNDDPSEVSAFRKSVRIVLRIAGRESCVAWLTIARDGTAYDTFNAVLREEAQRHGALRVVDWARMVEEHPEWLGPDGIHATGVGYSQRARSVARELRECVDER